MIKNLPGHQNNAVSSYGGCRRAIVLAATTLWALGGCGRNQTADSGQDPPPVPPVAVRAAQAERTTLRPSIELVGELAAVPERTVTISAQVAGKIERVGVVAGQTVRAGQEIIHLDARMAQTRLARTRAAVEQARAVLERLRRGPRPEEIEVARHTARQAATVADSLRAKFQALAALHQRHELSDVQYQEAKSKLDAAQAQRDAAQARLKLLQAGTRPEQIAEAEARLAETQAELDSAQLAVRFCTIASPIDGAVVALPARAGMFVEPAMQLATVVDLSTLFARVRVPSGYLRQVRPGTKVDVAVATLTDRPSRGTITRLDRQADPQTGDVDALASIPNPDGRLRPGLACRVRLWLPEVAEALSIPVVAIADREGTPVVTVIRQNKAYEVEVVLGVQTTDRVEVVKGLNEGDLVAVEGGYALPDGCPVRVASAAASDRPVGATRRHRGGGR